jgi:hypothetical protein
MAQMFQFLMGVAFGAAGYWAWQSFGRDLLGMGSDQDTTYGSFNSNSNSSGTGSFSGGSTSGTFGSTSSPSTSSTSGTPTTTPSSGSSGTST